jgi:hypothetical protein
MQESMKRPPQILAEPLLALVFLCLYAGVALTLWNEGGFLLLHWLVGGAAILTPTYLLFALMIRRHWSRGGGKGPKDELE